MAQLTLLSPEELSERKKPKRQQRREAKERVIGQFQEQLSQVGPGFGGEVHLEEGEEKRHVRTFLKQAAERLGLQLQFRPIKDRSRIEFTVVHEKPQTGRRGRPRKRR